MSEWEYKVAFVDFHGRISVEGEEAHIGNEHKTTFVRRYLDTLGSDGWDLVGIQPLSQHSAYYVFKRQRRELGTQVPPGPSMG
jgi:hypothetical protein